MKLFLDLTKTAEYRCFNESFLNYSSGVFNKMSEMPGQLFLTHAVAGWGRLTAVLVGKVDP